MANLKALYVDHELERCNACASTKLELQVLLPCHFLIHGCCCLTWLMWAQCFGRRAGVLPGIRLAQHVGPGR